MRYLLQGLDCASCAAKIEAALQEVEGLERVRVAFATQSVELDPALAGVAQKVIDRVDPGVKLVEPPASGDEKPLTAGDSNRRLAAIILSAILLVFGVLTSDWLHNSPWHISEYLVFLAAYLPVAWGVLSKAGKNILRGRIFDENFLMTIATVGAFALHELPEAVGVMLFYAVGEHFQELAVNRSRGSIQNLLNLRSDHANLKVGDELRQVSPEEVQIGQRIVVKPGERVPLDGLVVAGDSLADTSALTGESVPRRVEPGAEILAGTVNGEGLLEVEVTRKYSDSSVARILRLVEDAASRKAPTEQLITKFARYYTPAVVFGALALALVPPLILPGAAFSDWVYRALILLVISCPCALVVSIPLGYFGGIGGMSRAGILVKGGNYLEALADVDMVVFDKTGTLTEGVFRVKDVLPQGDTTAEELLEWAALAEVHSSHPIARSIIEAYGRPPDQSLVTNYQELRGRGVKGTVSGRTVLAGNQRLLLDHGIAFAEPPAAGTVVHVALDQSYLGCLVIGDRIKTDAGPAIKELKSLGVSRTVMLTGDRQKQAAAVAGEVGVDTFFAELLPEDKVRQLEELASQVPRGKKIAFVGDGVNDAPVLVRADVGVAMGGIGSEAAIEAADVVLMDDRPLKLARGIELARYTRKIVYQNIAFALGVKAIFVGLGVLGMATMWEAVFADVGVALLAILNATRTLAYSKKFAG